MARWLDDPEAAADALIGSVIAEDAGPDAGSRVLACYQYGYTPDALRRTGCDVVVWNRHMRQGRAAAATPAAGPYDAVILRLPKPRHEQEMALHQALAVTRVGGRVFAYGGNDEGVRSFQKVFASLVEGAETIAARGHGRVMGGRRDGRPVRGDLAGWIEQGTLTIDGVATAWISYPGLFAAGALDSGTALIVDALSAIVPQGRVLDYGCGQGAIARTLQMRAPSIALTLVDNDSVALVAAAANVPGAELVIGDRLGAVPHGAPFDLIVSNPPLHEGIREDHSTLEAFVRDARSLLVPQGALWMVVQRRVPCGEMLEAVFEGVAVAAEDSRYRVWRAERLKPANALRATDRAGSRRRTT